MKYRTVPSGANIDIDVGFNASEVRVNVLTQYFTAPDLRELIKIISATAAALEAQEAKEIAELAAKAARFQTHEIVPGYQYMFSNDLRTVLQDGDRILAVGTSHLINMTADSAEEFAKKLNEMSMAKKIKK